MLRSRGLWPFATSQACYAPWHRNVELSRHCRRDPNAQWDAVWCSYKQSTFDQMEYAYKRVLGKKPHDSPNIYVQARHEIIRRPLPSQRLFHHHDTVEKFIRHLECISVFHRQGPRLFPERKH
jgi:hypothetical protein